MVSSHVYQNGYKLNGYDIILSSALLITPALNPAIAASGTTATPPVPAPGFPSTTTMAADPPPVLAAADASASQVRASARCKTRQPL
ncbi:hypothetical protein NP233_g7960 [Leucocoprinus birnbaumii]|uniref:Uncharacterized protein n=1 Tax=Leucocoprinus birnbaumii TaxID=56174 RepID=A0AAD5VN54_9AGAR|nr:hypothetical protein NP233_g7960 [Leucocoprinus birnbaumii]